MQHRTVLPEGQGAATSDSLMYSWNLTEKVTEADCCSLQLRMVGREPFFNVFNSVQEIATSEYHTTRDKKMQTEQYLYLHGCFLMFL